MLCPEVERILGYVFFCLVTFGEGWFLPILGVLQVVINGLDCHGLDAREFKGSVWCSGGFFGSFGSFGGEGEFDRLVVRAYVCDRFRYEGATFDLEVGVDSVYADPSCVVCIPVRKVREVASFLLSVFVLVVQPCVFEAPFI